MRARAQSGRLFIVCLERVDEFTRRSQVTDKGLAGVAHTVLDKIDVNYEVVRREAISDACVPIIRANLSSFRVR